MITFNHCPSCGAPARPHIEKYFECTRCGYTYFFNAAAAVGVIVSRGDEILLLKRNRDPQKGLYALPGGFVDARESLLGAARRELYEEVGMDIPESDFRFVSSGFNTYLYKGVPYCTCDAFFSAQVCSFPEYYEAEEVAGLALIRISELDYDTIAFDSIKAALRTFGGGEAK